MKRKEKLVPAIKPLTPAGALTELPKGFAFTPEIPQRNADLKLEAQLYRALQNERRKNERLKQQNEKLRSQLHERTARRRLHKISAGLKPGELDRPAKKGNL